MLNRLRMFAKLIFSPLLYRYPPTGLQPERLALYLNALLDRSSLEGDVAEIGCNLGGTAVMASTLLRRTNSRARYICYDTFGGFVSTQFGADEDHGTPANYRQMFSANSIQLVRKILDMHGCQDVILVPGDIAATPEDTLSASYSVVLLDVDLSEPTYAALCLFWPRIVPGGAIFVDDCPPDYNWKTRLGYERFCKERGLKEEYRFGLAILRKAFPEFEPQAGP